MTLDRESFIRGSKLLKPIAYRTGLPLDHLNFIFAQALAIIFSVWFRKMFNRKKAPTAMRHLVAIITGCWLSLFCFGFAETMQLCSVALVSAIILRFRWKGYMQHVLLMWCMGYLSFINLKNLVSRNPDDYILDFTGPLMVMVQKITALGYSLADGRLPSEERQKLTRHRKAHCLTKTPSILECMSYSLNFFSILSGPFSFFDDFLEYMETDTGETRMRELVAKKIGISLACLAGNMAITKVVIWRQMTRPEFYLTRRLPEVVAYASICMIAQRLNYHFAWTLSDALNNSAGFGYNKATKRWDLVTNVNLIACEFADSPQAQMRNWNIQTTHWLRLVVYERAPKKLAVFMTFGLSAIWHGFFVGYYFLFTFGHFVTLVHRKISKRVTPIITSGGSKALQWTYTVTGAIIYHSIFNYAGMGILILSFSRMYLYATSMWFYGHVVLGVGLLIPTAMMQNIASLAVYGRVDRAAITRAIEGKDL